MKIISRGRLPKPVNDPTFNSCAFPGMAVMPSGRWLCCYKASPQKGDCDYMRVVINASDDQGATWSPPEETVKLPHINGAPGMSRAGYILPLGGKRALLVVNWVDDSQPELPYYDSQDESLKETRIFTSFTEDDGQSWSNPALVDLSAAGGPTPLTGPPLLLGDGTIICHFEINKYKRDLCPWRHRSAFVYSYDGGLSWRDMTVVTDEPDMYYWDQRPCVLADGCGVADFFWTLDGRAQKYLNIHGRHSADGGKTWGDLFDTGLYGQPGQPVDLGARGFITVDIDRSVRPIISARLSRDLGRTYEQSVVLYDSRLDRQDSKNMSMNEAWDEMALYSVGLPQLCRVDGGFLAYYYAGNHCDDTWIEFVRVEV